MDQRLRVGEPDILDRHAHQPPRQETRILAGVEHAGEIVRAPHPDRSRGSSCAAPRSGCSGRPAPCRRSARGAGSPRPRPASSKISSGLAARQISSARVSTARPSPSAKRASASRASGVSGSSRFSSNSARPSRKSSAPSSSDLKVSTRARDRSAALSAKDGFSVVAPTSVIVPSSITGRKASCWARLKRWISSTKSKVPLPPSRRPRAASNTFLRSATPEKIALICSKPRSTAPASRRATVVLPVPGGPQKIRLPSEPEATSRVSAPSGPVRCSWPATSAERRRPQAVGERARARLVEAGCGKEVAHPGKTEVTVWPPREIVTSQARLRSLQRRLDIARASPCARHSAPG